MTGSLPLSETAPDVVVLCARFDLPAPPVYVDYADFGYEQSFCHVSAKHREMTNNGKRVHGWAIWQFAGLAIAEFHSVWKNPDGNLVDVTPPKFNSSRVLFSPDERLKIEESGEDILFYTDIASNGNPPYFFKEDRVDYDSWPLPKSYPDLVRYCNKLAFQISDILT